VVLNRVMKSLTLIVGPKRVQRNVFPTSVNDMSENFGQSDSMVISLTPIAPRSDDRGSCPFTVEFMTSSFILCTTIIVKYFTNAQVSHDSILSRLLREFIVTISVGPSVGSSV
jgi:hypothetical protein